MNDRVPCTQTVAQTVVLNQYIKQHAQTDAVCDSKQIQCSQCGHHQLNMQTDRCTLDTPRLCLSACIRRIYHRIFAIYSQTFAPALVPVPFGSKNTLEITRFHISRFHYCEFRFPTAVVETDESRVVGCMVLVGVDQCSGRNVV